MYGIIDIGSNTMRLSCYRVVEHRLQHVFHKKSMAGLAGYVDDQGNLSARGLERASSTLADFRRLVSCVGLDQLYVVATASLRNVKNSMEVVGELQRSTGMGIRILSGEEEALYDFRGAIGSGGIRSGMMTDIGGGSTEFVPFRNGRPEDAFSMPWGSLNTFVKFVGNLFPTPSEAEAIRELVRVELTRRKVERKKLILGVGGTARACLKLYQDTYRSDHDDYLVDAKRLADMLSELGKGTRKEVMRLLATVPDRLCTILPGLILLDEICRFTGAGTVKISTSGLREGVLMEHVL